MDVRTRIAPSPTGQDLHIGNAYTALINYIIAKQKKGKFIVRIEDTDRTRFVPGAEEKILQSLAWLGITPDESPETGGPFAPYRQSERIEMYHKYAKELVEKGSAYYCFCGPQKLDDMRKAQQADHKPPMYDGTCRALDPKEAKKRVQAGEPYVIRLKVPDGGRTEFTDLIRGRISFENVLIDDQVILKSDGYPTYHLGVVVDDHLMEISHIIRGEEWISSTPKHVLLYRYFGWEMPVFAHVPLLRNPDKSKLSKRKNPVWVSWYKKEGILPEALVNYLITMGWSHPEGKEICTLDEIMRVFDLARIQTTGPVFDIEKLRWMNGEYIRQYANLPAGRQVSNIKYQIYEFFDKKYPLEMIEKIIPLVQERMKTLAEFESLAGFFFKRPNEYEKPLEKDTVQSLRDVLADVEWNHDILEKAVRNLAESKGRKARDVFMQLRIAVTGKTVGPPLLESMEILGKEESLGRLTNGK